MDSSQVFAGGTVEELDTLLRGHGIDTALWDKGGAKSLVSLLGEIDRGETRLAIEHGELVRVVSVARAEVLFVTASGETFALKEDRQVFADGRIRRRDIAFSVGEKLLADEPPDAGMARGIREELGLAGDLALERRADLVERMDSPSYPGLASIYHTFAYSLTLDPGQYRPEGYVEKGEGKTSHFVWVPRHAFP